MLLLASCSRANPAFGDEEAAQASTGGIPEGTGSTSSAADSHAGSGEGGGTGLDGSTTLVTTTGGDSGSTAAADGPGPNDTGGNGTATGGPGMTTTGATTGDPPPESCCSVEAVCESPPVVECACAADPERCCDGSWDAYCTVLAIAEACVACGPPPPQDCCQGSPLPGCNNLDVMLCVCADNPSCCSVAWEPTCTVAAVECPGSPCA